MNREDKRTIMDLHKKALDNAYRNWLKRRKKDKRSPPGLEMQKALRIMLKFAGQLNKSKLLKVKLK